ncbi:MAG: peptidoglycan-associated lipoprotein Pal [Methylococcales bacterium]|nr:peptidoglycan-associated lipoprotein Pal [Methylococcales bacterium]MCK5925462.1 peptidoglycan-associated lipoprotein Pal [Methylococcales bacterium]
MRMYKLILILAVMVTFLSACTNDKNLNFFGQDEEPSATVGGYDPYKSATTDGYNPTAYNPNSSAYQQQGAYNTKPNASTNIISGVASLPLSNETIYFLYDSSEIQPQFHSVVDKYSAYLRAHPNQVIVLEGHADERGSREYNVALGEERAKAVARIMQAKGVFGTQLEFVSYGEEKPTSLNHDESAWRLNRRVHLIYQRK